MTTTLVDEEVPRHLGIGEVVPLRSRKLAASLASQWTTLTHLRGVQELLPWCRRQMLRGAEDSGCMPKPSLSLERYVHTP